MCGTNDLQLDVRYKGHHEETKDTAATTTPSSHSRSRSRSRNTTSSNNSSSSVSSNSSSVEKVRKETQQLMEDCEQLVRIMTHVCSQQFSGACKTLARYSQGCWRGCSAQERLEGRRGNPHHDAHPSNSPSSPHPHSSSISHCPWCTSCPHSSSPSSYSSSSSSSSSCSPFSSSSPSSCQRMSGVSCKNCVSCGGGCHCDALSPTTLPPPGCHTYRCPHQSPTPPHQHHHPHLQKAQCTRLEEESSPSSSSSLLPSASTFACSCCRWRGYDRVRRCRRRGLGRCCQCLHCHQVDDAPSTLEAGIGTTVGGSVSVGALSVQPQLSAASPETASANTTTSDSTISTTTTTGATANHHHDTREDPARLRSSVGPAVTPTTPQWAGGGVGGLPAPPCSPNSAHQHHHHTSRRTVLPSWFFQARAPTSPPPASPKARGGAPTHPSLLTILLLLVVTLARFTDGCSSRSTPKPRPASPTMRPNITFQTYACPPAYAAWYCLNGATCFTVKIGESILYNCECADGYMGQRCEFKDLDGTYLPQQERVLLETASIAGGATVACVLVFIVLFAVYIFMQKDKDKRCRDFDDGRDNYRQPFSGYQNPRPEVFRTISNPYARTLDELSHVEVDHSCGHGNLVSTGSRNENPGDSGGNSDNNLHHSAQEQASSPPPAAL